MTLRSSWSIRHQRDSPPTNLPPQFYQLHKPSRYKNVQLLVGNWLVLKLHLTSPIHQVLYALQATLACQWTVIRPAIFSFVCCCHCCYIIHLDVSSRA